MFLGHIGVALAAKRVAPRVSLGTTIFAACFLDVLWPVLVLVGLETVEITPGITRVTPLDFTHYPWSHSLVTALGWGALFASLHFAIRRNARTWNSVPATLALEGAVFVAGIYIYVSATQARDRIGGAAFWGFIAFLVAWAAWADRPRDPQGALP